MSTKRALIVDDSTTAQYRLKKMLRPYGLHIDVMDSGEAALRYLATNEPDVIFMDHLMPGMDGFRVLQIIKSHPETATIPVIMYTSKSGDLYTGQARALGALDVVSKDTINASDLSKVLQNIHIAREEPKEEGAESAQGNKDNSKEFVAAANRVSDNATLVDRRAPNPASVEQARNLELRISHLELTLEDNRRFITSRVLRELQSLRQSMKEEFAEVVAHQKSAPEPAVFTDIPKQPEKSHWGTFGIVLVAMLFIVGIIYFDRIDSSIAISQSQQSLLLEQLANIVVEQKKTIQKVADASSVPKTTETKTSTSGGNYLADSVWAFNQSGSVPFAQNNLDPKVAIRLHEFISRMINSGFKGNVLINIYVGNFCSFIDNVGQAQLPLDAGNMNNCMLSSEIYGLDRVIKQYTSEIENVLGNLNRQQKNAVNIVMNGVPGNLAYPDRLPTTPIKEWNGIAQANNRIEIRLDPSSAP